MPQLTGLRCRACTMLGGTDVQTEAEAQELEEWYRFRPERLAAWREKVGGEGPPQVGEAVELEACVGEDELAKIAAATGRPCPLVPLMRENGEALELANMSLSEHLRPLAGHYFEALAGERTAPERERLIGRVSHALGDRAVIKLLYPDPKEKKPAQRTL